MLVKYAFCIGLFWISALAEKVMAQTGFNLTAGAAALTSGAFHVKCIVQNGTVTPVAYIADYRVASMFGAQFYHSKGELPFLLDFNYCNSHFSIDYKENMGSVFRRQEYNQHIFSGGITIEPLQNENSKWRYGLGIYCSGYQFFLTSGQTAAKTRASMLNAFLGAEVGIKLNSYFYLNAFFRWAPVKIDYVRTFQNLIPENYDSKDFHIKQRDMMGGLYLSLDFAKWFRDKDHSL